MSGNGAEQGVVNAVQTKEQHMAKSKKERYAGVVERFDPVTGVAKVRECRHVARWYGKTGGITSLAAHGLCGPLSLRPTCATGCRALRTNCSSSVVSRLTP